MSDSEISYIRAAVYPKDGGLEMNVFDRAKRFTFDHEHDFGIRVWEKIKSVLFVPTKLNFVDQNFWNDIWLNKSERNTNLYIGSYIIQIRWFSEEPKQQDAVDEFYGIYF